MALEELALESGYPVVIIQTCGQRLFFEGFGSVCNSSGAEDIMVVNDLSPRA